MAVITVRNLVKDYGAARAVAGISFDVEAGEVYGLLGENGAGKSTTVEILEGHRERTSGDVTVLGEDPGDASRTFRDRIGIVLQTSGIEPVLTVRELVALYGACYRRRRSVGDCLGGVNVAANVGHCAIRQARRHGRQPSERTTAPAEIGKMQELFRATFRAAAAGFTSSQLELHVAHDGRGVPSNHAAPEELLALAEVVGETRIGAIEFIPRSFLSGYDDDDRELIRGMATAAHVPVHLNTLAPLHPSSSPRGWERSMEKPHRVRRMQTGSRSIRCWLRTGRARTSRLRTRSCSTRWRVSAGR